ncbi:MAG: transcriptional repressor LexA [Ectothiorhodospiraceae bacterium]|nr:transcriptional repressor LexA [Ectothiorhodospiraceae bacterium]
MSQSISQLILDTSPSTALPFPKRRRPVWPAALADVGFEPEPMLDLPLLGWVTAGLPIDLCEQDERVRVPASMVRRNTYALRVRGHSMIDDNIQDGDIIVVEKRQTAENGQAVVALIHGAQVTLKKFYIDNDGIRLQPANPSMPPIVLRNEEIEILGIVTGVMRRPDETH